MIVDFDDFHETNHRLDLLRELRKANPLFRCTLFAVPGLGSKEFWAQVPPWCELIPHGWMHGGPECNDAHECSSWTYERTIEALRNRPAFFGRGWKSPGWQISDATYQALLDEGFWVADQHLEDGRRPHGLATYFYEDGDDRFHGHIQNVCGNGIEERWDEILARVTAATEFKFCSEATVVWDG